MSSTKVDLKEASRLAESVYNRDLAGNAQEARLETLTRDVLRDYNAKRMDQTTEGDVIYGFEHKITGRLAVVARGTDVLSEDALQYDEIANGQITDLGRKLAQAAREFSLSHGGRKVDVIGHSLGGHAAEEAGRLVPDHVRSITNFQGPSIRDRVADPFDELSPDPDTTPLGRLANDIPVNRITASEYENSLLGNLQRLLDNFGITTNPPNDHPIPVPTHDMKAVADYFENPVTSGGPLGRHNNNPNDGNGPATSGGPLGRPNNNPNDGNGPVTSGGPLGRPNNGGGEGGGQVGGREGPTRSGPDGDGNRDPSSPSGSGGPSATGRTSSRSSDSKQTGGNEGATRSGRDGDGTRGTESGKLGENPDGYGSPIGERSDYDGGYHSPPSWSGAPVLLDLDGDGISVTELSQSTVFVDTDNDGLQNRTAWAGAGDAVLFYDPDGHDAIVESRQFIFTEWDPTATGDLEAIRSIFDSNGDGKLTVADAAFADFKLMVTNDDGSTSVVTLAAAGIVEIDLNPDASLIVLPDGSRLTGQTTYTLSNGTTGTVANAVLMGDGNSYNVVQTSSVDGSGTRTTSTKGYREGGELARRPLPHIRGIGNAVGMVRVARTGRNDSRKGRRSNGSGRVARFVRQTADQRMAA